MRFLIVLSLLFASSCFANNQCDVSINYGVVVTHDQVRVLGKGGRSVYQINGQSQLFVEGIWIELTPEQAQQIKQLTTDVHELVPQMILLANEGVELAVTTIAQVYGGLVKDETSQEKLQKSLKRVQMSVKEKFVRANDNFYIGPGRLEEMDDFVDKELEEEIERAISTSVGGVLSAISGLVAGDKNTEEKLESIAKKLETVGEHIESAHIGPKSNALKHKAQWFCQRFRQLDSIEEQIRITIPQLKPFDVISTSKQ